MSCRRRKQKRQPKSRTDPQKQVDTRLYQCTYLLFPSLLTLQVPNSARNGLAQPLEGSESFHEIFNSLCATLRDHFL